MPRTDAPIHPEATPQLERLASSLRQVKETSGLSYRALGNTAHYSAASLSQAASGRKLPTWAITWAYVRTCDPDADRDYWHSLWESAAQAQAELAAARDAADTSEEESSLLPEQGRPPIRILVQQEVDRQQQVPMPGTLDLDTGRMALVLCTSAADFRDLLADLAGGHSPDHLKKKARRKNRALGRRDIRTVLEGPALPTPEVLHAFLVACDVEQRHYHEWHSTLTRLRIAQMPVIEGDPDERGMARNVRTGLRSGLRSARDNLDTMISIITLILMIVQIMQGKA
ncbi:helix-turn-helix domain-containing protein [Streptomyces sp. NPDC004266]|uniref:helix-turn-helix domain-containing protein n=1 Tax=Streptomyces sp. NPDC004266 TaxID=3364693 RepID=UPI0036AFB24F